MEIIIAVGIGVWFSASCVVASIALFKSFKDERRADKNK